MRDYNDLDTLAEFEVTDIQETAKQFYFEIWSHFDDGYSIRIAVHSIDKHRSLELFQYHHSEMVRLYTSLD